MNECTASNDRNRQVVVISPMAALKVPSTAGGLLLSRIVESYLDTGAHVHVVTPSLRSALVERQKSAPVTTTLYLGRPRDYRGFHRALLTLTHRALPRVGGRTDRGPWIPMVVDLLVNSQVRRLLRTADVVDLQWEEYGQLAPLLRRFAPKAVLTCMFHDVNSQKVEQRASIATLGSGSQRMAKELAAIRRSEHRIVKSLDVAFVLSEKDAHILRNAAPSARPFIVAPPLVDDLTPLVDVSSRKRVVGFVSALRRHENRDAAVRLATRIWPKVRKAVPDARLLVVGGGLESGRARALSTIPGVELTGFVDDLEEAYSNFRVTISPLDRGAGVKFKVIESIVRGIPTLTTSIGAEGIDPTLFTTVSDDDQDLARGAIAALLETGPAKAAAEAAIRSREHYGVGSFAASYQHAIDDAISSRKPSGAHGA